MPIMKMDHSLADPKQEIQDKIKDVLGDIQLTGAQVLVGIYIRPEKTKGGVFLTEGVRTEDAYQGKAALVLKLGPIPFDKEDDLFFGGEFPKVGDWIVFRPSDGFPMDFGDKQKCRILSDRRQIKMIVKSPDVVW